MTPAIPVVGTGKVDKKPMRRDAWLSDVPIWWRRDRSLVYVPFTDSDRDGWREQFVAHNRIQTYPQSGAAAPERL